MGSFSRDRSEEPLSILPFRGLLRPEKRNYLYPYLSSTHLTGRPTLPQQITSSPPTFTLGSPPPRFWSNHHCNYVVSHRRRWLHSVGFHRHCSEPNPLTCPFPLDGAGVDILDLPFWRDTLPRQGRSWTIIPSGRTSWVRTKFWTSSI